MPKLSKDTLCQALVYCQGAAESVGPLHTAYYLHDEMGAERIVKFATTARDNLQRALDKVNEALASGDVS